MANSIDTNLGKKYLSTLKESSRTLNKYSLNSPDQSNFIIYFRSYTVASVEKPWNWTFGDFFPNKFN